MGEGLLTGLVRKLELWGPLDQDDRQAILALPFTRKTLAAYDYIVREGDRPMQSCLLLSGYAFRQKVVAEGLRQILAVQIPGDMVDLENSLLRSADHSVQALTAAEVAFIPADALMALASARPAICKVMWRDTLVESAIAREWIANVGRRKAFARIAHLLCEFALRLEKAGIASRDHYEFPMTQDHLADATGLTPVHVNRTLRAMDAEGYLVRKKRSILINDWARLAQAGDFRSDYLHYN